MFSSYVVYVPQVLKHSVGITVRMFRYVDHVAVLAEIDNDIQENLLTMERTLNEFNLKRARRRQK